ncbi:hypothetical protein [Haloarcula sp. CGMCC 1.6347]|uniref:hypothetical protein n=1 Tax=Haloarcula sp. CGMCC 1.6347 TaxID=3111455 RepID=UPI00300F3AB2
MRKTSFSLREGQISFLDELVDDDDRLDADNRSELMRELIDDYRELRDRVDDLEADVEHAEARADNLRRQLQAMSERQDDVDELATYVQEERAVEQRRREAGLGKRAKWWLFGMPVDDEEER